MTTPRLGIHTSNLIPFTPPELSDWINATPFTPTATDDAQTLAKALTKAPSLAAWVTRALARPDSEGWAVLSFISAADLEAALSPTIGEDRAIELIGALERALEIKVGQRAHLETVDALGAAARVLEGSGAGPAELRLVEEARQRILDRGSLYPADYAAQLPGALPRIRATHSPIAESILGTTLDHLESLGAEVEHSAELQLVALGVLSSLFGGPVGSAIASLPEITLAESHEEMHLAYTLSGLAQEEGPRLTPRELAWASGAVKMSIGISGTFLHGALSNATIKVGEAALHLLVDGVARLARGAE